MTEPNMLEHAQKVAVKNVAELDGPDDDILPAFLWWGPHGMGMMPCVPMANARDKDRIAAAMTAAIAIGRAEQAVFVATSWVVHAKTPPDESGIDMDNPLGVMPSEHPDRQECISIMHQTKHTMSMSQAVLTRYPDRLPDVGEWETFTTPDTKVGGRFGEAINHGFLMVESMPPGMVALIEEAWENGRQQQLMQSLLSAQGNITGLHDVGVMEFSVDSEGGASMSARQMSQQCNIPLRTIYEVCQSGVLPAKRVKGKWRIEPGDAVDYATGYHQRAREMRNN